MAADNNGKKRRVSKKQSTKLSSAEALSLSALQLPEQIDKPVKTTKPSAQIEELIKQAFLRFYDDTSIKRAKVKDLEHLDHIAEEFLKTYIILGYDLNGEKVSIMHATNPHDKDALIEHLRTTLLGFINN